MNEALYGEGSPPNEIADQLSHSVPHLLLEGGLAQRGTEAILASQKYVLNLFIDLMSPTGFASVQGHARCPQECRIQAKQRSSWRWNTAEPQAEGRWTLLRYVYP